MNPDNNQYSIDYLNQIAPQQKKPGLGGLRDRFFFLIIGGGLALAVIVFALIALAGGSGPTQDMQRLAARLTTLQTIAGDAQKNLKSSNLRTTNSNLTIFLTNTNRDITEPLANNGVDTANISDSIASEESGAELTQTLDDARLNAVFDRTYAREMTYQLTTTAALMKEIYDATGSNSLRSFLEKTDRDLQPIITQFSDFSGTEG